MRECGSNQAEPSEEGSSNDKWTPSRAAYARTWVINGATTQKASTHLDESSKTTVRSVMFPVLKNIGCMSVKVGIL